MELLQNNWIGGVGLATGAISFVAGLAMLARARRAPKSQLLNYLQQADDVADFEKAVQNALRAVLADTGATAGYVMLADAQEASQLTLAGSVLLDSKLQLNETQSVEQGISGLSFSNRQTILIHGQQSSSLLSEEFTTPVTSAIAIPLNMIEGAHNNGTSIERAAGVLVLATTGKALPLNSRHLEIAAAYGTVLSMLVHNLQMIEFSRETIMSTLQEFAEFLDAKDPFSVGHSRRTAEIADTIAEKLGVEAETRKEIWAGAQLMDMGKIAISDSILRKTSGLTDEEFDVVRGHPLVSFQICRKLRMPEGVLLIVRNHHERLDGSGYPDQLRGGELPLALRIVCVADAYDAMRCARHYREGMSSAEALQELMKDAGTKFDPGVIEAVRELTDEGVFEPLYEELRPQPIQLRVA